MTSIAEIHRIAAAYPPEAAYTPADERERYFTDLQRAAWEMRFCRKAEQPSTIPPPEPAQISARRDILRPRYHHVTNLKG